MNPGSFDIAGWGFALAGAAYALLALGLLSRRASVRPSATGKLLSAALLATMLWCFLNVLVLLLQQTWALPAIRPAELVRSGAWAAWTIGLMAPPSRLWPEGRNRVVAGLVLAAWSVAGLLQVGAALGMPVPIRWTLMASLVLSVMVLVLLEHLLRGVAADARWGIKPIGVALLALFGFDVFVYANAAIFGGIDVDAYTVRGYVEIVAVPLIWMFVIRSEGWRTAFRVSQNAAFHSAALALAGAYLIFVAGVGYYVRFFGGEWGRALQQGMVFVALVVMVVFAVSGSMRARLRVFLSKNFFRYRYDYRSEWLKFTHALSSHGTTQGVGQQVIRGMADLVESSGGGLWIQDAAANAFGQVAQWNMPQVIAAVDTGSDLVRVLSDQGLVINLQEWQDTPQRYGGGAPPEWLVAVNRVWLVVPLRSVDALVGFVVLLQPRARFDLNWEVYDLLKTAGRQAASFLAQVTATEALLEARKFDAFNRMSAFVVHDLKNIVTQLSLMMKNAQRLGDNPEFRQDMLMTVDNALEKMRQLMAQLREGAAEAGGTVGVDLDQVLRTLVGQAAGQGRELVVRSRQPLRARGGAQRLERVIGHWVQNAIDATQPGQLIWLELARLGSYARLVVGDSGKGMSSEFVRDELFKPFRSTKGGGMGIGAYECQQYLQELGGKITVRSQVEQGTEIEMLLPLFELPQASDLDVLKSQP